MYYVAVDVGCIECGEDTHILGIFTSEEAAKKAIDENEAIQEKNWYGEHIFEIFEIEEINKQYNAKY